MGFHHIALRSSNYENSVKFYKALGFEQIIEWGQGNSRISMFDIGDGGIFEIFAPDGKQYAAEGRYQHFAFKVENVHGAYKHALAIGGKPHAMPKIMHLEDARPKKMTMQVAFVEGPDGELLEFFKELK